MVCAFCVHGDECLEVGVDESRFFHAAGAGHPDAAVICGDGGDHTVGIRDSECEIRITDNSTCGVEYANGDVRRLPGLVAVLVCIERKDAPRELLVLGFLPP